MGLYKTYTYFDMSPVVEVSSIDGNIIPTPLYADVVAYKTLTKEPTALGFFQNLEGAFSNNTAYIVHAVNSNLDAYHPKVKELAQYIQTGIMDVGDQPTNELKRQVFSQFIEGDSTVKILYITSKPFRDHIAQMAVDYNDHIV